MSDHPEDVRLDLATSKQAYALATTAVKEFFRACENGDFQQAEGLRNQAIAGYEAYLDAFASAWRRVRRPGC